MMRLLTGDVGSGKTTACLRRIAEATARGERCLLIVPEQETVVCETLAAGALPPESALLFEVTNFSRMANDAFRRYGGIARTYATPDVKAHLMYRTLGKLAPYLHTDTSRPDAGAVARRLNCVRRMHMDRLTPERLEEMAGACDGAALRDKLSDMAMISRFYRDALAERYADGDNDLGDLADLLARENGVYRRLHSTQFNQ